MDEESVIARASYPCFQITVENRDYHNLPQNEIAECPIPRVPEVGPSNFIPTCPIPFLYFRPVSHHSAPVLLSIWRIGVRRQKPDKEVRDRRLNESQPAPAG